MEGSRTPSEGSSITTTTTLIAELLDLRNDVGASVPRVSNTTTLVLLGAIWRQAGRSSADDDALAAKELLELSINDLYSRERDLLLAQFGFTYGQNSREARDSAYLKELKRRGAEVSDSTLGRWSKRGINDLAQRMVSRTTASHEPAAAPDISEKDPATLSEPFTIDSCTLMCRFRGRIMRDYVSEHRITSLVQGEHLYLAHPVYFSDPREGALRIEPEYGCELARPTHFEKGVTFGYLQISKALSVGESFAFRYRVIVDSDKQCDPLLSHTPDVEEAQLSVHLEFDKDAVPSRLWTFSNLPYLTSQDRDSRRQVAKPHDGSRYVQESWQGLRKNLTYGIDWEWPTENG